MFKAIIGAIIGAFIGFLIGNYYPAAFTSGLDTIMAMGSEPDSPYRTQLSIKYTAIAGLVGFAVGFMMEILTRKDPSTTIK